MSWADRYEAESKKAARVAQALASRGEDPQWFRDAADVYDRLKEEALAAEAEEKTVSYKLSTGREVPFKFFEQDHEEEIDPPDHDQWLRQIERVQAETGWKDIDV